MESRSTVLISVSWPKQPHNVVNDDIQEHCSYTPQISLDTIHFKIWLRLLLFPFMGRQTKVNSLLSTIHKLNKSFWDMLKLKASQKK